MHGHLGGMMTAVQGGEYIHGFASGAMGSAASSAIGGIKVNPKNIYWQKAGLIAAGGLVGGVSSEIAGGEFADGFRNGLISSGLNHAAHLAYEGADRFVRNSRSRHAYNKLNGVNKLRADLAYSQGNKGLNRVFTISEAPSKMSVLVSNSAKILGTAGILVPLRELAELEFLRQGRINRAISGDFTQPVRHSIRGIRFAGKALGYAGMAISVYDIGMNGLNVSNSLDLIMGGIAFVPGWGWVVSGTYFAANLMWEAYSGKTIGQSIQGSFTNPNYSIRFNY